MKLLLCGLAGLTLTACQSVLGFDVTPADEVLGRHALYNIYEHPDRDRVMAKPTGAGILTAEPRDTDDAAVAVRRYLDKTGRSKCPIIFVREISGPQYEFRFNCVT